MFILQLLFGYFIRLLEKREFVVLIRKFDLLRSNLEKEMVYFNYGLLLGNGLKDGDFGNFFFFNL